jgi:hypothetical protein
MLCCAEVPGYLCGMLCCWECLTVKLDVSLGGSGTGKATATRAQQAQRCAAPQ